MMEEFKKLGLSENVIAALKKKGYVTPTEIQQKTIPVLLEGKLDLIAQSQTGTGKTASFAIPIIEKAKENSKHVQAIILTPTRELALQVSKEIESLRGQKRLRVLAVYGGTSMNDQIQKLRQGIDIVVGTPGRVIDQIKRRFLDLSQVSFTVLDEADEMLNMGFLEEIEKILENTNPHQRMLLFSATMPKPIQMIAKKFMKEHLFLKIENKQLTIGLTEQVYYEVASSDKFEALRRVIDISDEFYGIIFCKTRVEVDILTRQLIDKNYSAAGIHGDISQEQREKVLSLFRAKRVNILIATDVAARGIDVNDLTHVVNYSLPQNPESYVHRIGRTGRAGKSGMAVTFIIPSERNRLRFIEKIAGGEMNRKELPSINEVIAFKKKHIRQTVEQYCQAGTSGSYEEIAKEILISNTPVSALASVLELAFKAVLNPQNYKELRGVNDSHRTSRKGKKDSFGQNYRKQRSDRDGGFGSRNKRTDDGPRFDSRKSRPDSGKRFDSKKPHSEGPRFDSRKPRSEEGQRFDSRKSRPDGGKRFDSKKSFSGGKKKSFKSFKR
ncbi:RNA helicase [Candidatus Woesearchaeota archaeon CG10_big_fil_rev_8_21_14_0_10_45_16]|nr:MAG: RNA helicase [Candidatus Woesearchaeota archaeon CG10_big_fil_rev_8_21_14_0_10_45_16]